jgi:hypothetical protein
VLWSLGWSTLFSIPKAARNAALVQFRNSPGALTFGERRALLTTTRCNERALSIDQLGDLSVASSAAANACHDFVRMELVANPDFHADLCGAVHRSDTPALMLNKYRAELTKYWLDRDGSRIQSSCRIHLPSRFAEFIRKHESDGL